MTKVAKKAPFSLLDFSLKTPPLCLVLRYPAFAGASLAFFCVCFSLCLPVRILSFLDVGEPPPYRFPAVSLRVRSSSDVASVAWGFWLLSLGGLCLSGFCGASPCLFLCGVLGCDNRLGIPFFSDLGELVIGSLVSQASVLTVFSINFLFQSLGFSRSRFGYVCGISLVLLLPPFLRVSSCVLVCGLSCVSVFGIVCLCEFLWQVLTVGVVVNVFLGSVLVLLCVKGLASANSHSKGCLEFV